MAFPSEEACLTLNPCFRLPFTLVGVFNPFFIAQNCSIDSISVNYKNIALVYFWSIINSIPFFYIIFKKSEYLISFGV